MAKIGILPLGRQTFDVQFAEENLVLALNQLRQSEHEICGSEELLFDSDTTRSAIEAMSVQDLDLVLILQVTFTDAAMAVEIAEILKRPLAIWAFPEARTGGRLRLNSFCGLNLASHAFGLRGISFGWLFQPPDSQSIATSIESMLSGHGFTAPSPVVANEATGSPISAEIVKQLSGRKIGCIGKHPEGFDTCAYEKDSLFNLTGVAVEEIKLATLFEQAQQITDQAVNETFRQVDETIDGLAEVDQTQLNKSLKLKSALENLQKNQNLDAFAIRCWPETFTEYGGAVCGPVSMMTEKRIPCACEADVYGALSTLIMQAIADEPVFLVDLVDICSDDNTGVVWHCGQAPLSMADKDASKTATVHSNRKMPLLFEFPLKPGRITLARLSQARGEPKIIYATGNMEKKPLPYSGTSGVFTFDGKSDQVLANIINSGLEHHMVLAYGDHGKELCNIAYELQIPVVEL